MCRWEVTDLTGGLNPNRSTSCLWRRDVWGRFWSEATRLSGGERVSVTFNNLETGEEEPRRWKPSSCCQINRTRTSLSCREPGAASCRPAGFTHVHTEFIWFRSKLVFRKTSNQLSYYWNSFISHWKILKKSTFNLGIRGRKKVPCWEIHGSIFVFM